MLDGTSRTTYPNEIMQVSEIPLSREKVSFDWIVVVVDDKEQSELVYSERAVVVVEVIDDDDVVDLLLNWLWGLLLEEE